MRRPLPVLASSAAARALAVIGCVAGLAGCATTTAGHGVAAGTVGGSSSGSSGSARQAPSSGAASGSGSVSAGPTTPSGSPSGAAAGVPTVAQLRAALLTAQEAGSGFVAEPDDQSDVVSGDVTGCPALMQLINAKSSAGPNQRDVQVTLTGGSQANPVAVVEGLTAEPEAVMAKDYEHVAAAIGSCGHLGLPLDAQSTVELTLSPETLAPGATAARMDGNLGGVPVNGDLAVDRIRADVALFYFFFQVGSGSSQQSAALFSQAVAKAQQSLP